MSKQLHAPRSADLATRLAILSDRSGGPESCWPYLGWKEERGYGQLMYRGERDGVHRWAWRNANAAEIPNGMVIRHRCDNPPCINPGHLELGTPQDNVDDSIIREHRSIRIPRSERAVVWARRAAGESLSKIASTYSSSVGSVEYALRSYRKSILLKGTP